MENWRKLSQNYRQILNLIKSSVLANNIFLGQGDGDARPAELASQLMQNPQVLAALQDKLGSMVGVSSGYIQRYVFTSSHQLLPECKLRETSWPHVSFPHQNVIQAAIIWSDMYCSISFEFSVIQIFWSM